MSPTIAQIRSFRTLTFFSKWTVILLILSLALQAPSYVAADSAREIRALWVIRTSITTPTDVRKMVKAAATAGFNTLIVQVRGRGDAFYLSDIEPRSSSLGDDLSFDPLELVIEEAHRRDIEVHAWVNTYLVWGPVNPPEDARHLVNAHPEWLAVPRSLGRKLFDQDPKEPLYLRELINFSMSNIKSVEGLFTSPSHPEVKKQLLDIWVNLASRYSLDGIHFDYVRFPTAEFDYSRAALREFHSWIRDRIPANLFLQLDAASTNDPYLLTEKLPIWWNRFRQDSVSELVNLIYHTVKEIKPDLVVSAAVLPGQATAKEERFQDWPDWLSQGIIDVAVPMAYTTDNQKFLFWIKMARDTAGISSRVWAGLGGYQNSVENTLNQIHLTRQLDAGGFALFAYGASADTFSDQEEESSLQQIGDAAVR